MGQALVHTRQGVAEIAENFTAKRVYSEPCQSGDITVIPAAEVRGGGGLGGREDGGGGGMSLRARPVGAYVIKGNVVKWKPALDLSRVIFGGQMVAVTALLVLGWIWSRR